MAVTILRNASVLDAERGELAEGQSVVVEAAGSPTSGPGLTAPGDALVLDVAGRTVMPGLIDAHAHPAVVDQDIFAMAEWSPVYVAARASRALLGCWRGGSPRSGTSEAASSGWPGRWRRGTSPGRGCSTAASSSARPAGRGLAGTQPPGLRRQLLLAAIGVICDGVPEVRRAVREEVRRGAHHIKVYLSGAVDSPSDRVDSTQFSIEELNAIVEEATAANIYVAGHAYTSRAINRGLECGVRSIEHGNLMDESSIPLFQKYGAFYVPTIVTYYTLARVRAGGVLPADIERSSKR